MYCRLKDLAVAGSVLSDASLLMREEAWEHFVLGVVFPYADQDAAVWIEDDERVVVEEVNVVTGCGDAGDVHENVNDAPTS